ncbi:monovalent cation/H+ antiporter subunit D [Brevundimonas sp.]|uniref:monovalent cation/H+ antiporter subunit D n=1 Tax=Brevundimonas sp. TaxID=1871086 RepID=UPI0028B1D5DD|nr:monovalent cation/H+ antiporter subunit D [Brevundimonas sp.]
MIDWQDHLIVVPVVLPLIAAAAMLLLKEQRYGLKALISLLCLVALVGVAYALLHEAAIGGPAGDDTARIYNLGAWSAPFGITLVADRLSTLMLALTATLAAGGLLFSYARWDRAGPRFHALYLLLVMGVNGAVLTGDLFNLFVFFEVMLAASYGLLLHGSGEKRVRAGLGYVAINLTASLFFLIGVSLIYGVTGALNMADIASKVAAIPEHDRALFHIGCAILGVAFLVKAAAWPLGFWLPGAYAAASAPVAAVFAILSKVGVYVILRLATLLFSADAGASAGFGDVWLLSAGIATVLFGAAGMVASRRLEQAAGYAVMVSSGTVLALAGTALPDAIGGALFYMAASTLAAGALFLIAEILGRGEDQAVSPEDAVFDDEYDDPFAADDVHEVGRVLPASTAFLGGAFILVALVTISLPPLAGFAGKLSIFAALLAGDGVLSPTHWLIIGVLTLSSFAALITLARFGVSGFWRREEADAPKVRSPEFLAIGGLVLCCLWLSAGAAGGLTYAEKTGEWLASPAAYMTAVLGGAS